MLADDIPREGIDRVVENVVNYIDSKSAELPRTLVDIVSMNGFAPYSFWPVELVQSFTHRAMNDLCDVDLIRATAVFHVTTRQPASTIPITRSVLHTVALRVWEKVLLEYVDGRTVVPS